MPGAKREGRRAAEATEAGEMGVGVKGVTMGVAWGGSVKRVVLAVPTLVWGEGGMWVTLGVARVGIVLRSG